MCVADKSGPMAAFLGVVAIEYFAPCLLAYQSFWKTFTKGPRMLGGILLWFLASLLAVALWPALICPLTIPKAFCFLGLAGGAGFIDVPGLNTGGSSSPGRWRITGQSVRIRKRLEDLSTNEKKLLRSCIVKNQNTHVSTLGNPAAEGLVVDGILEKIKEDDLDGAIYRITDIAWRLLRENPVFIDDNGVNFAAAPKRNKEPWR